MPKSHLLEALKKIDRPGNFCSRGSVPFVMPGLNIDGVGVVGFPTPELQSKAIIKKSKQAPYGKGLATVVDKKVRRVRELDPSQFSLQGPEWDSTLFGMISKVSEQLGIQGGTLVPDLYKLLIYGPGDFFLPHKDGEKIEGMVATLVVVLPSLHSGGHLVVQHDHESFLFKSSEAAAGLGIDYCAFYADCEHEVKPLEDGYRICLTYNLSFVPKGRRKKVQLKAPDLSSPARALVKAIESEPFKKDQLVIALEHQYSEAALNPDLLKGADKMRYQAIAMASKQVDCACYLALLTWHEAGSAEGEDDWYDDYRYSRHHSGGSGDHVMGEVYEESWILRHWVDLDGKRVNMGIIHIDEEDVLAMIPISEWEPSDEDFEGYTGNAGMTLDRWYHRAAIVLCPKGNEMEIFLNEGTTAAIGGLEQWIKRWKKAKKKEKEGFRLEAVAMAEEIMKRWESNSRESKDGAKTLFSDLILQLKERHLLATYFKTILPEDMSSWPSPIFLKAMDSEILSSCGESLLNVFKSTRAESLNRNIDILRGLSKVTRVDDLTRAFLCKCSRQLRLFLQKDHQALEELKTEALVLWVEALVKINAHKELATLVKWITKKSNLEFVRRASLLKLSLPKLKGHDCLGPLQLWLEIEIKLLRKKTDHAPRPYGDWKRSAFSEHSAPFFEPLNDFLQSTKDARYEFKAVKYQRQQVENQIIRENIDLTAHTIRKGSPHVLVLEKNSKSFERLCELHQEDLKVLKTLSGKLAKIG